MTISLGLSGYPSGPLPAGLGQALQQGSALGLSRLPNGLSWVVYLDGRDSASEALCTGVGG